MSGGSVLLGDVAEITMGQAPAGDTYNTGGNGLPLVAGSGDFGQGVPQVKKFTTNPGKVSARGDIIMSIRATIGTKVWGDRDYCLGRGVAGIRAKSKLDQGYLWHWLTHAEPELSSKGRGATFLQVSRSDIATLAIPLPPLDEQKRIAAILDKVDALRAKRRQAIALLDSLTQSIFLEMFGDPVSNPKGWPQKTMGDLNVDMTYGPRFYNEQYADDGIPIVRITDLSSTGVLNYAAMPKLRVSGADLNEHKCEPGDVLFARTGATVGKAALIWEGDPTSIPGAYFIRMRFPPNIIPDFAWAAIRHPSIQRIILEGSRQSAQQNFSGPGLRRLPFTLPPLDAQQRFAQVTRRIREFSLLPEGGANALDVLFASLQHRAFSGQL